MRFRRGVPAALREIVGKREITKSFGTNVLKDALPDYHRIATETERLFKEAGTKLNGGQPQTGNIASSADGGLTATEIEVACEKHREALARKEQHFRLQVVQKVRADEDAFRRGEIIELSPSYLNAFRINSHGGFGYAKRNVPLEFWIADALSIA